MGGENGSEDIIATSSCSEMECTVVAEDHGRCNNRLGEVIEQFAQDVLNFSSQYGSDISISYTAYNICGKPSKYPLYGDFPQTFVMRTYGKWWEMAPSRRVQFMPQNYSPIRSQDYIDISFEFKVIPTRINIYETYHPGSVVRIWARNDAGNKWKLLWQGKSQIVDHMPNIFSPPLTNNNFCTNVLRIEFNHSDLDYYAEIDAVSLIGIKTACCSSSKICGNFVCQDGACLRRISIMRNNKSVNWHDSIDVSDIFLKFLNEDYPRFFKNMNLSDEENIKRKAAPDRRNSGYFAALPDETTLKIMSYLDVISLMRCARVNRHFNAIASDSMLFTSLNLHPYWHSVNSDTLQKLMSVCSRLQQLDLSWCGNYDSIDVHLFCSFIRDCGEQLTHIRLDCCAFVNDLCVQTIASTCHLLEEITLHNCLAIHEDGFAHLSRLRNLHRLELYRTAVEAGSLTEILKSSPNLKHLNLGSCCRISSMDEVAQVLGAYNKQLVSVDFWKTYSLTPIGIKALSQCHELQEIDIGWCLGVSIPGDCFGLLALGCPALRKLFMGSLRGIMDKDLYPFLCNCPKLEQIDLLGNRNVTSELCFNILKSCKWLRFLDVSFCEQISDLDVQRYRRMFPNVDIKRSFQNEPECLCSFPNHY